MTVGYSLGLTEGSYSLPHSDLASSGVAHTSGLRDIWLEPTAETFSYGF